ncbi:thioesterase family protein [uncultured Parvibaculum sp.]|uniref:acyl-CoA thioesterase n=1 Tax=uncultured Parvibaculum sp. TaxID=291828 RepID=UPI0030DA2D61|tara:strand:- start:58499 stop:59419 length:921 start_codon:yes stop_codon:yes gene_type:complete
MSLFLDSFRGTVNTWECDEVGHMNVQFYVARASDAAFYLRHALGLAPSQVRGEGRAMVALEEHVRFHRELRAGDLMHMRSRPVEIRERTLVSFHELINSASGETAATIVAVSGHFDLEQRKLIPWPAEAHGKAAPFLGPLPPHAEPRSVARETRLADIALADAEARGFIEIYRGAVMPWECDDFGHMNSRFYMARFSDGAGHLWQALGMDKRQMQEKRRGTVVLEMRLNYLREVRSGAMLIVRSTLTRLEGRTLTFAHFMFDAETGRLVATGEAIAVMLDLDARRTVAFTDEERARLAPQVREVAA